MLYKDSVRKVLLDTLYQMQNDDLFNDYFLVGGTALSLHIGHRISEDIDLFTPNRIDKERVYNYLKKNISSDFKIVNNIDSIIQLFSDNLNLKIDFVEHPYKLLDPLLHEDGFRLVGLNDLSAMKISAIGTRGNEAKDFVDLYYLLDYMSFDKIIFNFKDKYENEDIAHYLKSIVYFDDVPENSWKAIKLINNNVTRDEIKNRLVYEVCNYQKLQYNG